MSGHRRQNGEGAGPPPPTLRAGRQQRRRTRMAVRMAKASTPLEKYTEAAAYLRSALGRRQPDPERAARRVGELTETTIKLADDLLLEQANERLHPARTS